MRRNVIDRPAENTTAKSSLINNLWILSKVAERKDRVSGLMRKNAFGIFTAPVFVGGIGISAAATILALIASVTWHLNNVNADSIDSEEELKIFTTKIINDLIKKISEKNNAITFDSCPGAIAYLYRRFFNNPIPITKDPDDNLDDNLVFYGAFYSIAMNDGRGGGLIHNGKKTPVWKDIAAQIQKDLKKFKQKIQEEAHSILAESEEEPYTDDGQTLATKPRQVVRPASSIDLTRITDLLTDADYGSQIKPGTGWNGLDAAFRSAVSDYVKLRGLNISLNNGWQWSDVASQLKFNANLTGAEDLVKKLIELKNNRGAPAPSAPAAAPVPAAATDYTAGAKSKLKELFNAILARSTKVDKVGIDLRRDTMIFEGVIAGLGGADAAVDYVFSQITFNPQQLKEISDMNLDSNQKITVSALALVRNRFMEIRIESTRGIRDNAFNAKSLAKAVNRWKSRQQPAPTTSTAAQPITQASILRAIEIRKMAARKKLGI
jgi:hypothetical protein